jgi:hypothetical protein
MKAIINGRIYDTEKATLIGEATGGSEFVTDFSHWSAGLYVTPRSGRYFLAGRGGPMTTFRRTVGQSEWTGGEKIIPMAPKDALEWAEQNLPADTVAQHFAHLVEEA